MYERDVYVVQPYKVGAKDRRSLAIVIPARIVKERSFNTSTVFALNVENDKITLRTLNMAGEHLHKDAKGPFVTKIQPPLANRE